MNKHGWTYKKLGEVASYVNGFAFKPDTWSDKGVRIIRIQNLNNEAAPFNYYDGALDDKYLVREGDLLISWSASLGVYIWRHEAAYLNQHIFKVIFNKGNINKRFLAYSVESKLAEMSKNTHGSTMRHIVKKDFDNTKIPVPSIEEQAAIVAELDEINEAIAMLKQQVADLDILAQSTFYSMFGDPVTNERGWEVKKLGELAMVRTGPFGSMLHKEDYIANGIPLVNPIHMKNYMVVPDMNFTISESKAAELSNYILKENDVVFARRGDIGRCAVINKQQIGYLCGTGSLFVRFKEQVNSIFIMYVIRSQSFANALIAAAKGATMLNINSNTVENLIFILPPIALQQEFAAKVGAIESAKAELNAQIVEMQNLLASRMDYYFD